MPTASVSKSLTRSAVRFAQSGLETKMFGCTEEIGIGERLSRLGKLMAQL